MLSFETKLIALNGDLCNFFGMNAIYFDTETTGIKTDKDRITEIAAFDPKNDRTFEIFVNPGIPIPAESTAITNITDEMVAGSPSFKEVGQQFIDFCGPDAVLIAHNLTGFDMPILRAECARHDLTLPDWRTIDTLKWARKYRPDLPRHALQYLREAYGMPENNAHRALEDVRMMYAIFPQMFDYLPVETILELLSVQKKITHMPFGKHQGKPLSKVPKDYLKWLAGNGAFDKEENKPLKESLEKLELLPI